MKIEIKTIIFFIFLLTLSCDKNKNINEEELLIEKSKPKLTEIKSKFISKWDQENNIDSPAFWQNPNGKNQLIVTSQGLNCLVIYDAENGEEIRKIGSKGTGPLEFDKPRGISIWQDLLFVVEANNSRIQVLRLPDFEFVTFIGDETIFERCVGLSILEKEDHLLIYTTDNYYSPFNQIPSLEELNKRVKVFEFSKYTDSPSFKLVNIFGDTTLEGAILDAESIKVDPENEVVLIANEMKINADIKVYDLEGNYMGISFGGGIIKHENEDIGIFDCGNGKGFIVVPDEDQYENAFHIFDRKTYKHLGSFITPDLYNTDAIEIYEGDIGTIRGGVLFALYDDGGLGAYSWQEIADSLSLNCQ